jgi:phage baseplate assembly protein V
VSSEGIGAAWPMRIGIVKQQDVATARVRVTFRDLDQMTSYWLPVVVQKSQDDKAYWMPDIGEQVVCLMDAHCEAGVVLGAIYSQADTTPAASADKLHIGFKDGAAFEYDRATHVLDIKLQDGGEIRYDAVAHQLTISSPAGDIALETSEHKTTMNTIIDTYNSHAHPDPQGGNTGAPSQVIP